MLIGPKYKICKRLGSSVFEKCQTKSFAMKQDSAKTTKKRPGSDFSRQLIEKQKMRMIYSLTEKQFASYVHAALNSGENPSQHLFASLESRLDSVCYRMGLAPSRRAARQLATHGHLTVNGRRTDVPSTRVAVGSVVAVRPASKQSTYFESGMERIKEHNTPAWITFDPEKLEGTLSQTPVWGKDESTVDYGAVFEFYTR